MIGFNVQQMRWNQGVLDNSWHLIMSDSLEVLLKAFHESAVVPDEEVPADVDGRLSKVIQRVHEEYHFNLPDYKIDEDDSFKKVECAFEKEFYDSLCNAKVEGGALKSIDMHYYGIARCKPVLLRSCYFDMFELILDSLKIPSKSHWHLILGSPGIGKSWFHVFCLYVLVKANAPFFLQRMGHSELLFNGQTYRCKRLDNALFTKSNIWLLYDGIQAPTEISPTNISVMVSSLRQKTYKEYAKMCRFGVMYMPLWNYTELTRLNLLSLPMNKMSEEGLKKCYRICGGVARHIFDHFTVHKAECVPVISGISIGDLDLTEMEDIESRSHNYYGLEVSDNYFEFKVRFLTKAIAEMVGQKLLTGRTLSQLFSEVYNDATDAVCGMILESEALKRFVSGYKVSLRSLDDNNRKKIVLPDYLHRNHFTGNTLENIVWNSGNAALWIPEHSKYPCLLLLPKEKLAVGFLFTGDDGYPVSREPLAELIQHCHFNGFRFKLAFVLTERNYESFAKQRQRKAGSEELFAVEDEVACPQYKVMIS